MTLWHQSKLIGLSLAVTWAVLLVIFYKVGIYYGVFG